MLRKKSQSKLLMGAVIMFLILQWSTTLTYTQEVAANLDSINTANSNADATHFVKPINLGQNINSPFGDYAARVSTDGKTLYFCRKVRNREAEQRFLEVVGISFKDFVKLSKYKQERRIRRAASRMSYSEYISFVQSVNDIDGQEDIYISHLKDGQWGLATAVGFPLNTSKNNEAPESISTDNNQLFVFKNGDVYLSKKIGKSWNSLEKLEYPINSSSWDADICFSSDGRTLFFASKRPGFTTSRDETDDNVDIWVTLKSQDGWAEPVNLGEMINTTKTDRSPFLHADGKTLYFASNGHSDEGHLDIFKTTRLSDSSWTDWSEPVNLKNLNSSANDWDLTMPANSRWAYFVSDREGGHGQYDIYKYQVDSTVAPKGSVTLITGLVTAPNGEPLEAEIRWEDLDTGELIGIASSNPVTGEYTIALPAGKRYGYYATKDRYWDKSDHIDLKGLTDYRELQVDIQLHRISTIEQGTETDMDTGDRGTDSPGPIPLTNIFFEFDSYELDHKSHSELNRLAEKLLKHPEVSIQIQGHTDNVGTSAYNENLSQRRAGAVRDYLISQGVESGRLVAVGFGESTPVASNLTEEERALNRRVQFVELSISKK